tara:strand:+ start:192 stop:1112 length:921 start_codon:yes stop_codon:yes gene_type:complete
MANEFRTNSTHKYSCDICDYSACRKSHYDRHLQTARHKKLTTPNELGTDSTQIYSCHCGKEYKHLSSLCKHKKNCTIEKSANTSSTNDDKYDMLSSTIMMLVNENREFKQLLVEQNAKMMEMAGNMGGHNHHNTTNTNSHNKFNLNVFLNEQCKDAMTLKDFVKSMEISMEEFIETGEIGFVDGLSQVLIQRIGDMDIHDRPIHCTDLKRETVYVKDAEKWEKDTNQEKFRKAIKGVAYKNERMRPKWYAETPNVEILGSENCEKFFKYSAAALGGFGTEENRVFENKIMKNVMKEVTIDKQMKIE